MRMKLSLDWAARLLVDFNVFQNCIQFIDVHEKLCQVSKYMQLNFFDANLRFNKIIKEK